MLSAIAWLHGHHLVLQPTGPIPAVNSPQETAAVDDTAFDQSIVKRPSSPIATSAIAHSRKIDRHLGTAFEGLPSSCWYLSATFRSRIFVNASAPSASHVTSLASSSINSST